MAAPAIHRAAWFAFDDLAPIDLYAMLRLRGDVFVVEQRCAFAEIDGLDPEASHLLVWLEADAPLSGCLRLFAPGTGQPNAQIGRVATSAAARGLGLGRWMMREGLAHIDRAWPGTATELGAQVDAERFYASLGFVRTSADYDEDGIAHCTMARRL